MNVARPSDRSQSLLSTSEFIIEVVPKSVMGVGNCSHRTQLLLIIRLVTKAQVLCDDYREATSLADEEHCICNALW